MTPVLQTRADNCFAAAVASLLDLRLSDVPDFNGMDIDPPFLAWLGEFGLTAIHIQLEPGDTITGLCLGSYRPKKSELPAGIRHACVCKDGKVVWDPIGEDPGDVEMFDYTIIYPKVFSFAGLKRKSRRVSKRRGLNRSLEEYNKIFAEYESAA
jgi:hypothetical protein